MSLRFYRRLRPFSVITFDLDDTLYDNAPVMVNTETSVQRYIEEHYPSTKQWDVNHWRQRRLTLMQQRPELASNMTELRIATLRQGFAEAGEPSPEHAAEDVMEQFHHHRSNFEVPRNSHQMLAELNQHVRVAAISNGNVNCQRIGIDHYFDIVVQPNEELRGKPHADMFHAVANFYQVPLTDILHVGDHPRSDILGAHRSGCQSGWFTGGLGQESDFTVLPTFEFADLHDLVSLSSSLAKAN